MERLERPGCLEVRTGVVTLLSQGSVASLPFLVSFEVTEEPTSGHRASLNQRVKHEGMILGSDGNAQPCDLPGVV